MRRIQKSGLILLAGLMALFLFPAVLSAQEGAVRIDSKISISSESITSRTVESFKVESRIGKTPEEIESHREEIEARRKAALEEVRERQAERKALLEEQRVERETKLEEAKEERETRQTERAEELSGRQEEVETRLDAIQVERCTRLELNIERQVSRFETNRIRHLNIYTAMSERLKDLLSKLVEQGADVSEMEDLINQWDQMIEDFRDSGAIVYDRLVATQRVGCGEDDVFVTRLNEARSTWRDSRDEVSKVRSFYTESLRPALIRLRESLAQ